MTNGTGRNVMTAAEAMAQMDADSDYQQARAKRAQEMDAQKREWAEAERPILHDLAEAGVDVNSIWSIQPSHYPECIPVLLTHLQKEYPDRIREGIALMLAVPAAREPGWDIIKSEYLQATGSDAKTGLANAIAGTMNGSKFAEVEEIVRNDNLDDSRIIIVASLRKKMRSPEVQSLLEDLVGHPVLGKTAEKYAARGR